MFLHVTVRHIVHPQYCSLPLMSLSAIFTPDAKQTLIPFLKSCKDFESLLSRYEKSYGAAIELSLCLEDLYFNVVVRRVQRTP